MTEHPRAISVGIGPDGSAAAVRYAVDQAVVRQATLHLIHVLNVSVVDPFPLVYDTVVARGRELLSEAASVATDHDPAVEVTTELVREGSISRLLVERSAASRCLVVEHHRRPQWRRMITGSVANGVSSRSRVPVVAVPEDWRRAEVDRVPRTTVAVQDPGEAPALLAAAMDLAAGRDVELVLMHAWWLDNGFDLSLEDRHVDDWTVRVRERLEEALAKAELGDVPATVRIEHRPPGEALVHASAHADLLVIGRRHHLLPIATHLGPNARGAIDHATCPVALAGE